MASYDNIYDILKQFYLQVINPKLQSVVTGIDTLEPELDKTLNQFDVFRYKEKSDYITIDKDCKISFATSSNTNIGQIYALIGSTAVISGTSVGKYSVVVTKGSDNTLYLKRNGNSSDYGIYYDLSWIPSGVKFKLSFEITQMNSNNFKPTIIKDVQLTFDTLNDFGYLPYYGYIVHEKHETLLWQNANPNTYFTATTVTIDNSGPYKYLIIQYKQDNNPAFGMCTKKMRNVIGTQCILSESEQNSGSLYTQTRSVTINSTTQIAFGPSYNNTSSNSYKLIPVAIYGTNVL